MSEKKCYLFKSKTLCNVNRYIALYADFLSYVL